VRYVVWSADMAFVALLGKHGEFKLEYPCTGYCKKRMTYMCEWN